MINENNLIEKSKALVWAKFNTYTANELKLLEVYLSKINARDPDSSLVEFTKREYCTLMGLHPETKTEYIQRYTEHFLGNVLTLNIGSGYKQYTLFTYAECSFDEEIGQNVIKIRCNPDLSKVFFNIAEDGYIRYKLKNVTSLKSQYSVRLYSLLKDRSFGKGLWEVDLKELRELMGATDKSYEKFKEFNRSVLQKCESEINELTDITFSYERIVKGRLTRGIKFKIKNKSNRKRKIIEYDQLPGQLDFNDTPSTNAKTPEEQSAFNYCKDILGDYNFTDEQIDKLMEVAENLVPKHFTADGSPAYLYVGDILKEKLEVVEEYKMNHQIDNMFRTFYAAVVGDWQPNHPIEKPYADDLILKGMNIVPAFRK